jgi:hypothetical protein
MGAVKNINVTGANKNTAASTPGGTYSHFRVYASNGTTPKTGWCALTTPRVVGAGGMLNVVDAGIQLKLGVAGNTTVGQFDDAILTAMLDLATGGFANTDVIKFATSSAGANSTDIANYAVDAWDAATTF